MEYLIGSIVTLLVAYFVFRFSQQQQEGIFKAEIFYSQSYIHTLISPFVPSNKDIKSMMPLNTQSKKYLDDIYVNVIVFEGNAYWIKDNAFFTAEADGATILKETTKRVDTMGMDKVELDKIAFIVDLLTKGK